MTRHITESITDGIHIIYNFMDHPENIVSDLVQQCNWNEFTIKNKVLCRTGEFQGDQLEDSVPWIRCPSIEHQPINVWSPVVYSIKEAISKKLGYDTNIGKIQCYKDGGSFINTHSDKIIDLDTDTPIFVVRFGAERTCVLVHKNTNEIIKVKVPHNSLLIISYDANLEWKHGILKESGLDEPSYSIVFRKSVTYKHDSGYIYGCRTGFKTKDSLCQFLVTENMYKDYLSQDKQLKKMIEHYKTENKTVASLDIYEDIFDNSIYPF